MKLCRIETPDGIKPAMIDADGAARDLTQHLTDIELATMAPAALDQLRDVDVTALPVITGRFAPVINDIRRILCIGLNYSDHAAEAGMDAEGMDGSAEAGVGGLFGADDGTSSTPGPSRGA